MKFPKSSKLLACIAKSSFNIHVAHPPARYLTRQSAMVLMERWRQEYDTDRTAGAPGDQTLVAQAINSLTD